MRMSIYKRRNLKRRAYIGLSILFLFTIYAALVVINPQKVIYRFYSTFRPCGIQQELAELGDYRKSDGESEAEGVSKWVNSTKWEEAWPLDDDKCVIERAYLFNLHHEILNEARYGWLAEGGKKTGALVNAVIVVMVHDRLNYLRYLVESLAEVQGIEQALLVFSHDLISPPINQLIRNITFARVIQLLYPYSIQFFPNCFPGQAPDDCPERVKGGPLAAKKLGCKNWAFTGRRQRYRVAEFCQLKHHHWWKMNYVFDGIVKRYGLEDRMMLMLEEDEMVAPDLIHAVELMEKERAAVCPECQVLSLGHIRDLLNTSDLHSYPDNVDKLTIRRWEYYHGMAFSPAWWWQFREACAEDFCTVDEYNLHWTLYHLSPKNGKCAPLKELRIEAPRVIHVGDCGMHHEHNCTHSDSAALAKRILSEHRSAFFPDELHLAGVWNRSMRHSGIHGGWSDPRDHELCRRNTHPTEPITLPLPMLPPSPPLSAIALLRPNPRITGMQRLRHPRHQD